MSHHRGGDQLHGGHRVAVLPRPLEGQLERARPRGGRSGVRRGYPACPFPLGERRGVDCSAILALGRGVKGSEKRGEIGYCGPGRRTHVCDAAHDYFNYLILFTN